MVNRNYNSGVWNDGDVFKIVKIWYSVLRGQMIVTSKDKMNEARTEWKEKREFTGNEESLHQTIM